MTIKNTRYFTMGPMLPRARTTDAAMRDILLTTPTPAELAEWGKRTATMSGCDLGRLWVGDLTSKLDAVKSTDPAKFADAMKTITDALADYGNDEMASGTAVAGPSGSLAFNGGLSKAAVGDSGGAQLRRWRDGTSNAVARINAENASFWAKVTAHQRTSPKAWGKS